MICIQTDLEDKLTPRQPLTLLHRAGRLLVDALSDSLPDLSSHLDDDICKKCDFLP